MTTELYPPRVMETDAYLEALADPETAQLAVRIIDAVDEAQVGTTLEGIWRVVATIQGPQALAATHLALHLQQAIVRILASRAWKNETEARMNVTLMLHEMKDSLDARR